MGGSVDEGAIRSQGVFDFLELLELTFCFLELFFFLFKALAEPLDLGFHGFERSFLDP